MKRKIYWLVPILLIPLHCLLISAEGFAELKLESVYPTLGVLGQDLAVSMTGTGFDGNTRVSMALDVGNRAEIVGSVDTPERAESVAISGITPLLRTMVKGSV